MRISFDVDDTLVCDMSVPIERPPPRWRRLWYPEALRRGATGLMRALLDHRHEVWIYTTSYRSPFYVRGWLRSYGVPVSGVVNQRRHDRVVGRRGPSKLPPLKSTSHLPLLVDPSHGTGRRDYVPPMAMAALAAGADGLLIEVHPDPDPALSDGAQAPASDRFERLLAQLRALAGPPGRSV